MFEATQVSLDKIQDMAKDMLDKGFRFVTETVVDIDNNQLDILYHFDKGKEIKHYRLTVDKGTEIPSISSCFFAAALVENENRDLFGISYKELVLDFNRTLYLDQAGDPMNAPFCKITTYKKNSEA